MANNVKSNGTKKVAPKKKRKRVLLKKSARRTVGAVLLATSLIVAAIPSGSASAITADALDGGYQGSTESAPELDNIKPGADKKVENPVPGSTSLSKYLGGYPLITSSDNMYSPEVVTIGGRQFYAVNKDGYSAVEPIYILGSPANATNPASYLYKYIGESSAVYIPPNGTLNLVAGYVQDFDMSKNVWKAMVGDEEHLFGSEKLTYTKDGKTLYGKVIHEYEPIKTYTVKFISDDKVIITTQIKENHKIDLTKFSETEKNYILNPPSVSGKEFLNWTPGNWSTMEITQDMEFVAVFKDDTPADSSRSIEKVVPVDNSEVNNQDGDNNLSNDSVNEENGNDLESNTDDEANGTGSNEETEDTIETETVNAEYAEGRNVVNGINGVLLASGGGTSSSYESIIKAYEDDFNIRKSTDTYVCDYTSDYMPITAICDNSFKDVKNVLNFQMPSYILQIGDGAFSGCEGLSNITLGSGLQNIGKEAFKDCKNLTSVFYHDAMALRNIGDKAFANTNVNRFTLVDGERSTTQFEKYGDFSIPYTVSKLGAAAFYNTKMASVGFEYVNQCTVGDFCFAKCNSLQTVDLNPVNESNNSISNLAEAEGLFRDCQNLWSVSLPTQFTGSIKKDTFGNDTSMQLLKVRNRDTDFADGEFDNRLITVEGPEPQLKKYDATGNVKAYTRCLDPENDYTYRYRDVSGNGYYDYVNQYLNLGTEETPNLKPGFIFKIKNGTTDDGPVEGILEAALDLGAASSYDLVINDNVGERMIPSTINIRVVGESVFEGNNRINKLTLPATIKEVKDKAFSSCGNLSEVTIETDGTILDSEVFANNNNLTKVKYICKGTGDCYIGSKCFGSCPNLENVEFLDDEYQTGNINDFARFPQGSIASDAFYSMGRTKTINFKGPMFEGYAPYEFAIDPQSRISNQDIFSIYRTGNPQNLKCQYKKAFKDKDSGSNYPAGVYLLEYPNMTTKIVEGVSVKDIDGKPAESRKGLESDIVDCTKRIVIPYGIDYIDIAESKIESSEFFPTTFNDSRDLYTEAGNTSYKQFKYVKGLEEVEFADKSVSVFPDRMFEACPDLKTVIFWGDVEDLGVLPFYFPDSEDTPDRGSTYLDTFRHGKSSPSVLENVFFQNENLEPTATNPVYTSDLNSLIIKERMPNSKVNLVEILPSRGKTGGDSVAIKAEELSDVTSISDFAARDCDSIKSVDLSMCDADIPYGAFMDCDMLSAVKFPEKLITVKDYAFGYVDSNIQATLPNDIYSIETLAFIPASEDGQSQPAVTFNIHNTAEYLYKYADEHDNITTNDLPKTIKITYKDADLTLLDEIPDAIAGSFGSNNPSKNAPNPPAGKSFYKWLGTDDNNNIVDYDTSPLYFNTTFVASYNDVPRPGTNFTAYFYDYDYNPVTQSGTLLSKQSNIPSGSYASVPPITPAGKPGSTFIYWAPDVGTTPIYENTVFVAQYKADSSSSTSTSSSSTTSSSSSSTSGGGGGGGTSSSSSKSSSSSSSSSTSQNSSTSTVSYPVILSGNNGTVPPANNGAVSTPSGNGGTVTKTGGGKTSVISSLDGVSDTGKMSATVNGSSDNYIVKITQTQEANDMAVQALRGAFGDLEAIRYLPMDISLYDSTGTNKISPIPAGTSVSVTIPIPDDLAIYGGNAKVASTVNGSLEKIQPRFTVINGVPCMTFVCTHLSPYVVYVDTANLADVGIADSTPKTADPIHPKWFLCIGLAAVSILLFIKKDPEEYLKGKAQA